MWKCMKIYQDPDDDDDHVMWPKTHSDIMMRFSWMLFPTWKWHKRYVLVLFWLIKGMSQSQQLLCSIIWHLTCSMSSSNISQLMFPSEPPAQNIIWPSPLSHQSLCSPSPPAPLVKWGRCPFCHCASEECGMQQTQHSHTSPNNRIVQPMC